MAKRTSLTRASSVAQMVDLAGPVSDRVQIQHVILAESTARRQSICAGPPADLTLQVAVTTSVEEQDLLVRVLPRFTLVGRGGPDNAQEALRIEALFVVDYSVPSLGGLKKQNFDAFGQMNGVYNVWPYWREFVQSMTVRMGLPPLTVPVFRPLAGGGSQRPKGDNPSPAGAVPAPVNGEH